MFTAKPKTLTLTLVLYIALAIVLATGSEAKGYAAAPVHRREHHNLNRLIRKRAPQAQASQEGLGGILGGAGNAPPSSTDTKSASASASQSVSASASASTTNTQTSATSSASASSSAKDPLGLSSIVNGLTATSSSTSSSVSSTFSSSSSSSSSSVAPTTSSSALPLTTASSTTPLVSSANPKVTVTTEASEASATTSAPASTSGASKVTRTTVTILIVIAASVAGVAIIWTIIRKWKFSASSSFDDRMKPIDWQPTTGEDNGLPTHRRGNSDASSFHSGNGHDNLGSGYGSTVDHGRSPSPLPPLPDHDFTAGTSNLAPVGGYADLARGPSPQPQMQEPLSRGPSLTRPQYDQYGVPLHHQGGYDAYDRHGGAGY